MAISVTIGGKDFTGQYQTGSIVVSEQLANKANTLSIAIIKKPGEDAPQEGEEIVVKDGTRILFGGYISKSDPEETGKGQLMKYKIEGTDYTYIPINKNAQKVYHDQTLKQIVEDLVSLYIDSGYGITTNNVEIGPTITTIAFDHIPLRKCFEKLQKLTGYVWWIDYEKDIHFVSKQTESAPEKITSDSQNFTRVKITRDTSQVRNSIVVQGGQQESSSSFGQVWEADGVEREWILRSPPATMVSIEIDDGSGYTSKSFGVDPLDEDADYYFMFNFQEKYVRMAEQEATPAAGTKIRATYYYYIPIIVQVKGATSIDAMKALEGGDGVHDYTITDTSIESKVEAREKALEEIREYGNPTVKGQINTHSLLLQSGSVFKSGQALTINLPEWGINENTVFLIQKVEITPFESEGEIYYNYNITFGGRLMGLMELLQSKASEEKIIQGKQEIDRIEAFAERIDVGESIARDAYLHEFAETINISELFEQHTVTPPWKWEEQTSQPVNTRWDNFEWA